MAKNGHVYRKGPGPLGEFRVDVQDPGFTMVFSPRANN
jgi:hypothetical protein